MIKLFLRFSSKRNGLFVWISVKKFDIFLSLKIFGQLFSMLYPQRFRRYVLLVFHVEFESLHRTFNRTDYLIHGGNPISLTLKKYRYQTTVNILYYSYLQLELNQPPPYDFTQKYFSTKRVMSSAGRLRMNFWDL